MRAADFLAVGLVERLARFTGSHGFAMILAALIRAYDLEAGDVIHVDTGIYNLATNVVLTEQDSGVTIRGAQQLREHRFARR